MSVKNANPNGDPLNGNRPRTDYEGLGEITDVCLKRKIRDRLVERFEIMKKEGKNVTGQAIFVQSDDRKCDDAKSLKSRAEATLGKEFGGSNTAKKACETWIDVRAFGQLFALKSGKKSEENEGDTGMSIGIRGPMTIQSAFSVEPVSVSSNQITKSVNAEDTKGDKRSSDTMGMKHRVDYGVYVTFGSMNPQLAERTLFSDADAGVIKEILPKLFENDASSARPEGSMRVLKVIWWQHNCPSGQASSAKVHGCLQVADDGGISFKSGDLNVSEDGTITIGETTLKPEIIEGF
jgi:CRISPR-associated protein Csd2